MKIFSLAKIAAGIAVAGTLLTACVVVEEGPGMRPPPPPGPPPGRGEICTREYAPVCGERRGDRQTFGNACVARAEGFRILHDGECRRTSEPPRGGPLRPCTQQYEPVCAERGGDRRTFGNSCAADNEGYSIRHAGECRGGGGGGGGTRWR